MKKGNNYTFTQIEEFANVSHEVLIEIQSALKEGYKNFYRTLNNKNRMI